MSASDTDTEDGSTDTTTAGTFAGTIGDEALSTILDALDAANEEAVFEFHDDRLVAHTVDPASVLMASVEASPDAFEAYDANDLSLGIELAKLQNANVGEMMALEWNVDTFKLAVESGPAQADLSTIDPGEVRTQEPSEKIWDGTEAVWEMPYDDLKTALSVVTQPRGSAIEVHANPDFIGLRKKGDTDSWETAFENASEVERDGSSMCIQNEDYLKSVRQAIPTDVDTLTLSTGSDWPLVIEYTHAGVDVTFVQAPRIDNN